MERNFFLRGWNSGDCKAMKPEHILLVADLLPIVFEKLMSWCDDRIRALEAPAYWLIEVSLARSLEEAVEVLREVVSGNEGTMEERIAIVIEGCMAGVISLNETIWRLWRIWQGPDYSFETNNFPSELSGFLMDWDMYGVDDSIPDELRRETVAWYEEYREKQREICELVRPIVFLAQGD